jgi:hypothetical protein
LTCVWMCGTEYGGGGVDDRRYLFGNAFTGPLPAELGESTKLCVRPALALQCGVSCSLDRWGG